MNGWDHVSHLSELEKRCASLWFRVDPATVQGPVVGMIVGECPGLKTRATLPMFPYPANSSGGRLLKMSELPIQDYLGRLTRRNLFYDHQVEWDRDKAIDEAVKIVETVKVERVVLCGQRVAEAFGFRRFFHLEENAGVRYCAIPHPSDMNRIYNQPQPRLAAKAAIRWVAGREVLG